MEFEELVAQVAPRLKRITSELSCRSYLEDGEDLYQEAMVYLLESWRNGKWVDKSISYIVQGCYFYLRNYLRAKKAYRAVLSLEEVVGGEENLTATLHDVEGQVTGRVLISELGLTSRELQVLGLIMQEMSTREIGALLGISHVRVVKIRQKVREKYLNLEANP